MMVSVVIPVYNTPVRYLKRCLDSIERETSNDIEIIIVDDGSLEEYSIDYKRIVSNLDNARIITQKNAGVSAARNLGINESTGKYIAFVDSDDAIENGFIDHAIGIAEYHDADIVIGEVRCVGMDMKQTISKEYVFKDNSAINAEKALLVGDNKISITGSTCGRLYRTELVKKTLFAENIRYFEDQIFNIEIFRRAHAIIAEPETWYVYYNNSFSAMGKARHQDYFLLSRPFMNRLYEIIQDRLFDDIHDELCVFGLNMVYNIFYNIYAQKLPEPETRQRENSLYDNRLVKYLSNQSKFRRNYGWKTRRKIMALKHRTVRLIFLLRHRR